MAAGKRRAGGGRRGAALLSGRLLRVLTREMDALERASDAARPKPAEDGGGEGAADAAGSKARIEAVGQMTRTLEKLLDLRRLEALAVSGDSDDAEAARLREELLRRLRALDARRRAGATLFGDAGFSGSGEAEAGPAGAVLPAEGSGSPRARATDAEDDGVAPPADPHGDPGAQAADAAGGDGAAGPG